MQARMLQKIITVLFFFLFFSTSSRSQAFVKNYSCTPVLTEAKYADSLIGWEGYLFGAINRSVPFENCAPQGMYTAEVRFLVEKDGRLADVKALTKNGYGMEAELVRVVQSSPQWIPATQNGKKVRCYKRQVFVFVVSHLL